MASVLKNYQTGGLAHRVACDFLVTHRDGSRGGKLLLLCGALLRFFALMVRGKGQILHVHTAARASFYRKSLFVVCGRLWGRRVILHLHSGEFPHFFHHECGPLRRAYIRLIFALAHRTVVLANPWVAQVQGIVPSARIRVLHNPVAIPAELPDPRERSSSAILFLGRLGPKKGLWDLLEVAARLCHTYPDLQLWLCGDGDREPLEERLKDLHLANHVKMLGWVAGPRKDEVMRKAAILVLPSYFEGLPMGVLEAMACGMPVVATDVGGVPDAIPDATFGRRIRPGQLDELEEALAAMLGDPALRIAIGRKARERAEEMFALTRILDELIALYRDVLTST